MGVSERKVFQAQSAETYSKLQKLFENGEYAEFDRVLKSNPAWMYFSFLSNDQILTFGDAITDYIGSDMPAVYEKFIRGKSLDVLDQLFAEKKPVIIKSCMTHPEVSEPVVQNMLRRRVLSKTDFVGYETGVQTFSDLTKEVIDNSDSIWKLHDSVQLLWYNLPKGKEWDCLEWLAENDPEKFKKVANSRYGFSRTDILSYYESNPNLAKLPLAIQDYVADAKVLTQKRSENAKKLSEYWKEIREERQSSWFDDMGCLLQFFKLEDGFPIKTAEDYLQIAEIFKNSGMSAYAFCKQYKIDSVEGFRDMLKKVAYLDPEFEQYYKTTAENNSRAFLSTARKNIADVAGGSLSVSELAEEGMSSQSLKVLLDLSERLFDERVTADAFVKNVLDYYHKKLNSYGEYSTDVEDLKNRLTLKEMRFLFGEDELERLKQGKNVDLSMVLAATLSPYLKYFNAAEKGKIYDAKTGVKMRIKSYSSTFSKYGYLKDDVHFLMLDGTTVKVTPEMVDMAECFVHQNGLFRANSTVSRAVKAVAEGKIQNQSETQMYKSQLKKQIVADVKECKTLQEYFAVHKAPQKN